MIVIVCGIPGSGKTTLSTGVQRRFAERGRGFELRHSDDYSRRTYDRLYADVANAIGEQSGTAHHARDWILDGTFYRREWRNRFYRLDDTYEVWVKASLETCLARNRARSDAVPEKGVGAIRSQFESPRADLEIDTDDLDVEAALDQFENAVLEWLNRTSERDN